VRLRVWQTQSAKPAAAQIAVGRLRRKKRAHCVNTTLVVSQKQISLKSLDKRIAFSLTVKKLFLSVGTTSRLT